MSSFSSETLHPRARPAPLPSLCMSPSTQVAADQRAVGNRHHLFNRTVGRWSWDLVCSVGLRAQSVACGRLCGSGVALPPLRPQSSPRYPDCTAITHTTPWSRLRLARPPLHHMLREWRPWPLPPTTRPPNWQLGPTTGCVNPSMRS